VAYGSDIAELFANAAYGMFAIMADIEGVEERREELVLVEAIGAESLMVGWLTELLYYVDAHELLFRRFEIDEIDDGHIVARAFGEKIDRERHDLRFGIKAVTRHMLEVGRKGDRWEATILFDI
jgi:SHS2 domain-containing protein